jgi:hypothetical protein
VSAEISGLTISGGRSFDDGGGAIKNVGRLLLSHVVVTDSASPTGANVGGGILNYGALTVTDSSITSNRAGEGGGIANLSLVAGQVRTDAVLELVRTHVDENAATLEGGGIANIRGAVTVTDGTVSGNRATIRGGGITGDGSDEGRLTLQRVAVSENVVESFDPSGGGIATSKDESEVRIYESLIQNNRVRCPAEAADTRAVAVGGGIRASGRWTIFDTIISGNTVTCRTVARPLGGPRGGGIYHGGDRLVLVRSAVRNNRLEDRSLFPGAASGIFNAGSLRIEGGTLEGNTGGIGGLQNLASAVLSGTRVRDHEDGGLVNRDSARLELFECEVSRNRGRVGGGIANSGELFVFESLLEYNEAEIGGAISNGSGNVWLSGTTCFGNAADRGGCLHNGQDADHLTVLRNVTIALNHAREVGGGISNHGSCSECASTVRLTNVTLNANWNGNLAGTGGTGE